MPIQKISGITRSLGTSEPVVTKTLKPKTSIIGPIIIGAFIVLLVGAFAWFLNNYLVMKKKVAELSLPQAQQEMARKDMQSLLEKVGKLIILPAGEEPTVATVTDVDTLKAEQQFYRDAQNGNKVLVYMQEKKAIIYDEQRNILVNVGPIFVNDTVSSTQDVAGGKMAE